MPAKNTKKGGTPTLCVRRSPSSGRSVTYATFNGKCISFGPEGDDARRSFDEFLARWIARGRCLENDAASIDADAVYRIEDLVADYLEHARAYYVDATTGAPSGEFVNVRAALAALDGMFAQLPVVEFGPLALQKVRDAMVRADRLCRKQINARVHRIRRAFKWAANMQLVPAPIAGALELLDGLKQGKSTARESKPIEPVPEADVAEIAAQLCPTVRGMVWLQWWTGCRPGEACALRWSMIDRTGPVWIATFAHHKNAWRGRSRVLSIGPRAQEHLRPLLRPVPDGFVFSPARALFEQRSQKRELRRSKVPPSQQRRAEAAAAPHDQVAESFTVHSYRRAIDRAVRAANAARVRRILLEHWLAATGTADPDRVASHRTRIDRASIEALVDADGAARVREVLLHGWAPDVAAAARKACDSLQPLRAWGPNRLRHSAATRIRREEGLEAARVVLGHARATTTEIYAEVDHERSRAIMERLG